MRGLVLAAGRGSRLGGATADRPKCLVDIDGRRLLDRQVASMRRAGIDEVGVVTGWCADTVAATGLRTFHNDRWADTTMVGSLAAAGEWLSDGPVVIGYGDIVYGPGTVRALAGTPADLAVSYDPDWARLWHSRFERPLDDAETFRLDGDRVTEIGGRPRTTAEVEGQYVGLLRCTPRAWSVVSALRAADPAAAALDMTGLLRRVVSTGALPVTAVPVRGRWFEFDHPSDLELGLDAVREVDAELAS